MITNQLARITAISTVLVIGTAQYATNAFGQTTYFKFTSTPGSWVGHGYLNYSISPASGWVFTGFGSANQGFVQLSADDPRPVRDIELLLGPAPEAPNGGPLVPGFYSGATRYPFNDFDEPGLYALW